MKNPQQIIDEGPMGIWQVAAIATTVFLNALDGFDAATISFAAPGIAKEWGLDRAVLGWVLSMELIGMAAGSILLGGLADRIGRRPTIIGSLVIMTIGMAFVMRVTNITELSVARVMTGLGIGGMLAALTAVVAEYSNTRRRNLALSIMVVGYPLGAVLGGMVTSKLLESGNWRSVFEFGTLVSAVAIPLAILLIPESPAYLNNRRPANALSRINRTLRRFGLATMDGLAELTADRPRQSVLDILKPGLLRTTLLITFAYFAHITCYYFIMKWIPKLVVDMGHDPSSAANILVWAMLGGAVGGPIFGFLAQQFTLKATTIGALLGSFLMVNLFGNSGSDLGTLAWVAGAVGFFANSAGVGFYALLARAYPTHVRATGTGFGIGVGRAGAAMGPAIAGQMFHAGMSLPTVSLVLATGSLLAVIAIWILRFRET